jgi:sugar lactone lactonase YvrE
MKKYLFLILLAALLSQSKAQVYNTIVTVAGGNGFGNAADQFNDPVGFYMDGTGNIYVADKANNRIQKFPAGSTSSTNGTTVAGGNGEGSGANQLSRPNCIFVDNTGNIYVSDYGNVRVQKFPVGSTSSTNGTTVAGGNGQGSAANQFASVYGLFVDTAGNIYVADDNNNRIQKFPAGSTSATNGITVAGWNGGSIGANQLFEPYGIYFDRSGNLYVADYGNFRVQKFPVGSTSATNGVTVAGGNGYGTAANQLSTPTSVYVDSAGNLYVTDNGRVQKFAAGSTSSTNGVTVAGGFSTGTAMDQLGGIPIGVYVDAQGDIYVGDQANNRIQKWSQAPAGISTISTDETISLYPNPNTGSFILQSSGSIGKEYMVYDMIGRSVAQGLITSDKQNIALKGITMGSYTLEIKGNKTIRFVVEN